MPGGSFLSGSLAYPTHRQEGLGAGRTQGTCLLHIKSTCCIKLWHFSNFFVGLFSRIRCF